MLIEHDFGAERKPLMKNPSCLTRFGRKIGQQSRENQMRPVKNITRRKNRLYKKLEKNQQCISQSRHTEHNECA